MLKTKIKASQITNLTDARYFAAWDVRWLGFCLDANTDYFMPPPNVAAIKEWVEGPKIVGEFGLQTAEEIRALVDTLELDAIQVGMLVGEDVLEKLDGISIFKEIVLENLDAMSSDIDFHLDKFEAYVDTFILVFDKNKLPFSDWTPTNIAYLADICTKKNIILAMDVVPTELDELLEKIQPLGLQVKGGEEEKVGFKSFDELDDIFEALETFE